MPGDPSLLILLHADPLDPAAGGTEMHVLDRIESLGLPRVVVVYPSDPNCVTAIEFSKDEDACYSFVLKQPLQRFAHTHPEAEQFLLSIAATFNAAAVSVEQMVSWPLHAIASLRQAGLPYVCVNHDFYCVCPSFNLIDVSRKSLCEAHEGKPEASAECLRSLFSTSKLEPPAPVDCLLEKHHGIFGEILSGAEKVVFPSNSARRIVLKNHRLDEARTVVIPHGYPQVESHAMRPGSSKRLRVALIGQVTHPIKGSEFILELLSKTASLPLEWHFFGECDTMNFQQRVDATGTKRVYHGAYSRTEIIGKLVSSGVDVALFTSICPETFSFTLSEAWLAGVPVIVPRLGALEERVSDSGRGWIVEPNALDATADLLRRLQAHREFIEEARANLSSFRHTSLAENAAAYRSIYAPLLLGARVVAAPPQDLQLAAQCYLEKLKERREREAANVPEYKRSAFYDAYRRLKHLLPHGVRQTLYKIIVKK